MADEHEQPEGSQSSALMDHHSMTAKGIKHLCSELLEINKASEEDFRSNLYGSYLSFLRLLGEGGDLSLDKDIVGQLKRQAIEHRELTQQLLRLRLRLRLAAATSFSESEEEDIGITVSTWASEREDELDILLSEHRMDEALKLLEVQAQDGHLVAPSRSRVADRLASVAANPRTPHPELLVALSSLCSLGGAHALRANHLLFNHFSLHRQGQLQRNNTTLTRSGNDIKELARAVFTSILQAYLQASTSFAMLHQHGQGRPSPDPELGRWAREEMEDLTVALCEYVRSITMSSSKAQLGLALDAANHALSCCSVLSPLGGGVVSEAEQALLELMRPCLEEVVGMHAAHLNQVVRLLVASDSWALGTFPLYLQHQQHCLLTTSGRKFVTLIQEVVGDVSPLLNLGMKSSAVQLLADLFREYMLHSIQAQGAAAANESGDHHQQQLSVLINCTTLVSLFPIIARRIFDGSDSASQLSTQTQLDTLVMSIQEAAAQLWTCFCQQFIRDTMSMPSLQTRPTASLSQGTLPQGIIMPSFAFQALFLRVRQLNNLYGAILCGKDRTMKKLLQELMQAMILWLSNNLDYYYYSLIHQVQSKSECVREDMFFDQIQLDIHFLLEFAQLGDFSSEGITSNALGLLRKAREKVSHGVINSGEEGWASEAAKHAVQVLMTGTQDDLIHRPSPGQVGIENAVMGRETGEEIEHSISMLGCWSNDADVDDGHGIGSSEACTATDEFISVEDNEGDEGQAGDGLLLLLKDDVDIRHGHMATAVSQAAAALSE